MQQRRAHAGCRKHKVTPLVIMCSITPSKRSNFGPAAEMSAPESGRAGVSHVPLTDKMRIEMVGAGSVVATCFMVDR